jgi:predicted ATPase/class 3 adenylate cyclase
MLTFLFTDIEGSTRRWGEHPEAMSAALVRHDELLRGAIESHGGHVFKHMGDGIAAVFGTPYDALCAAVTTQRSLHTEAWGPIGDLPVRMGIHIGRAEYRTSDYFGPTLNRVARLMATAHGGQIVVSLPIQEIVRDDLPPEVGLLELGEHRLKDLARPEHVFQVVHPDLPATFPPLRSLAVDRHNLPVALTNFVGRRAELERTAELLRANRLVTLTGIGGTGKSRLAIQAATGALDAFTDGVYLVELAPLTEPELVPGAVSTVLGAGEASIDRICEHLRARRLLLILDNCEHLIAAAARLCEVLLGRCPQLCILATSREALDVPGEAAWRVPSLSLPPADVAAGGDLTGDAVALFCDRARAVDPEFRLGADNAHAVARICRRLDGIPLALELAAARLRMLRPDQVAQRLDDRFGLLTGGGRNALRRHQTLRAAMDWSYDLLSPAERTLLGRLSVFAGSFSMEAAETVGADGRTLVTSEVFELLSHLVDKSLVVVETGEREARYRLLETVRQYGRERLDEAEDTADTARRHRDFFLHRLDTEHEAYLDEWTSFRWLGPDRENVGLALQWSLANGDVDAALRLAVAMRGYWSFNEQLVEGAAVLEQCLERAGDTPTSARVYAMCSLALLYLQQGDTTRAEAHLRRAKAAAVDLGDSLGRGFAQGLLGMLALQRGDLDRAEHLLREGVREVQATRPETAGWLRFNLCWVASARGDVDAAAEEFEVVRAFGEETGNESLVIHTVTALAPMLALAGEYERAADLAAHGIEGARRMEVRRILVMALIRGAEVTTLIGIHDRAEEYLGEVLAMLRNMAGHAWVADAVEMTALIVGARGRHRPAARLLGACDALRDVSGEVGEVRAVHSRRRRYQDEAASVLGAAQFEDEHRRGAALSRDAMVREALTEIRHEPVAGY